MMKRKILLILNMAIIGFSTAACSEMRPITSLRKKNIRSPLLP